MDVMDKIIFEKPVLHQLINEYTVFDMHFHSKYSDGRNTIAAISKKAYELGIGIAITDHNDIRGAVEISQDSRILSIPAIEITSISGTHLLIYFYSTKDLIHFYDFYIKPNMGKEIMSCISLCIEEIIMYARRFNSVIIFPHPYSAVYTGVCNYTYTKDQLRDLFKQVDGVEVINAGNLNRWNLRCAVLGFNLNKAITGGSDGHSLGHMATSVSCAPCEKSRESFLNAIKDRQNRVIGKEISLIHKVTVNSMKLRPNLKSSPEKIEKNIRYGYAYINVKSKTFRETLKRSVTKRIKKNEHNTPT